MITWSKNYELGIERVDKQHRCLVDIINQFIEIVKDEADMKDQNLVEAVFMGLISYSEYHFENEEMVMQECNYSDFEKHRKAHDNYFTNIHNARQSYMNGDISSLVTIIEYLEFWIVDHIIFEDKKYAPVLMEKF